VAEGNGQPVMEAPAEVTAHLKELASIQAAYDTLQQRDGTAERRARNWQVVALFAIGGLILTGIWDHFDKRKVPQPFVQTVQVTDTGKVQNVGMPIELMDYTPQEEQWRDMLGYWVQFRRWRSGEPIVTQRDWAWIYAHTCGKARELLNQEEKKDKPLDPLQKKQVSVAIESVTKSPAPLNYQVLWQETTLDPAAGISTRPYSGTFVVARYQPPNQAALMLNRLGLCVSAYDITPRP
jgi:type IV secretory pathway TrbF-like protein